MIHLIAEAAHAAPTDAMIPASILIGVIGAIASGVALVVGKVQGRKEAETIRIKEPVPTVPTSKVSTPPTWSDHKALADRVTRTEADVLRLESEQRAMAEKQSAQYASLLEAGANRAAMLGNKMDDVARAIHARIDQLIQPKTRQ